jgi:septum formation protein
MTDVRVILASSSPRRTELLSMIGIPHTVSPADIDESVRPGEAPAAYAERLAREKAQVIAGRDSTSLVVAADTTVVIDGHVLGKPVDAEDAARMLHSLSGRTHTVLTAVAVARGGRLESAVESVVVTFRTLSDGEIAAYVATGEPMDKAGSYGIQGYGATIVTRIDGDYFAVMGLALTRMILLIERLGIHYDFRHGLHLPE